MALRPRDICARFKRGDTPELIAHAIVGLDADTETFMAERLRVLDVLRRGMR